MFQWARGGGAEDMQGGGEKTEGSKKPPRFRPKFVDIPMKFLGQTQPLFVLFVCSVLKKWKELNCKGSKNRRIMQFFYLRSGRVSTNEFR